MKLYNVILLLLLLACKKESVNIPFSPIVEETKFDSLKPAKIFDYYEIRARMGWQTKGYEIVYSFGDRLKSDSLVQIEGGATYENGDITVYYNILARFNNEYEVFETYDKILEFLGKIDSKSDALLVLQLNGYFYKYNDENCGIRNIGSKYQIYALKTVHICTPVQTDIFLIEINSSGNLKILFRTIYSKYEDMCI
jgi:hypothetical protein